MNVQEMHIEVQQQVQHLASNRSRKLLPEEIDWLLNKNQDRFIELNSTQKRSASGFSIDQNSLDKIRTFLTTSTEPVYYKDNSSEGYVNLPPLYRHLVADRSRVVNLCGAAKTAAPTAATHIVKLKVPVTTKSAGPFYTIVTLKQGGTTLFDIATYATDRGKVFSGYTSKAEVFNVRNLIAQALFNAGIKAYWERWDDIYLPGTFILELSAVTSFTLTIDSTIVTYASEPVVRKKYTAAGKFKVNRLYPSDLPQLKTTAFSKTYYESPVTEMLGDRLWVYTDESFIVTEMGLTYIRMPKKISIILGQDSELPEGVHGELCDLTVEYIKELIKDPNWETKLQDNQNRTTI